MYETIGVGYSVGRRPERRWQEAIDSVIGDAKRVISIGAGTRSYEPSDRTVIAVEPSKSMVNQYPKRGRARQSRGFLVNSRESHDLMPGSIRSCRNERTASVNASF